jgi:hypothetical protein
VVKLEMGTGPPGRKSDEERKKILSDRIQRNILQGGSRVESQSDFQAVLVRGHRPNHVLHLLLTIFTLGLWAIVWIGVVMFGGEKRALLIVDEYGNTQLRQL